MITEKQLIKNLLNNYPELKHRNKQYKVIEILTGVDAYTAKRIRTIQRAFQMLVDPDEESKKLDEKWVDKNYKGNPLRLNL